MGQRLALFNTALITLLLLATAVGITPVKAEDPPPAGDLTGIEFSDYRVQGLGSSLAQLVKGQEKGQAAEVAQQFNIDFKDNKARVIIEALPGKANEAAALARSLGADVETTYDDLVQVTVPATALAQLAGSNAISLVRQPYTAVPSALSEGVSLINANAWQAAGYNGAGTKVGILDLGFSGYTALLGTDLPATVTTCWAPSLGGPGDNVHGTACTEVVYDVAPGAQFYLANYNTDVEYANAVNWLISQGVNVIAHSCCWLYDGPGNGTGLTCSKVDDARAAGITWVQAAGNYARSHWAGYYRDSDRDSIHEFVSSPIDEVNYFWANTGDYGMVSLRWNDTWGASNNDYNLYLLFWNGTEWQQVASSTNPQDGNDNPVEYINGTIPADGWYGLVIHKSRATGTQYLELIAHQPDFHYAVAAGSLPQPADSRNAITVGAVRFDTPGIIEPYSSRGPTVDRRVKPDLVGPTNVSNTTFGTFVGTSPAASHVAGAALLIKQVSPSMTPAQIQASLESNTVPLGNPGKDNIYGSGRILLSTLFPPSNLVATPVSSSRIDLAWDDNSGNETGFKIERKKAGGTFAQIGTVAANVHSYSNTTGLTANTRYFYRVRAYLGTNNSAYSNEDDASTLPLPPAPPTLVRFTGAVPTLTPTLDWNDPVGAVSYGVQVSTVSNFATTVISQTGLVLSTYPVTGGLNWNTTYYWRANASNSFSSTSNWSAPGTFKTALGPPPDAPSNLVATPVSATRIDLAWNDNSGNESGFKIERKKAGTTIWALAATVGPNVNTYSNTTGLTANTRYFYRVRAYNFTNNYSDYSNEDDATTLPLPPAPPTLVRFTGAVPTLTPTLDWNDPVGAVSYGVQVSTVSNFATTVVSQTGLVPSNYPVTGGLNWNTTYYWRANATNSFSSTSNWSAIGTFKTTPEAEKYAVIVGISNYYSQHIDDLDYADDDAQDMYNSLVAKGWPAGNIRLRKDSQATKATIQGDISWMRASTGIQDTCLFYFSGYGSYHTDLIPLDEADGLDEYIHPYDSLVYGRTNDIRDDELAGWLSTVKASKVVILDCCYSGGFCRDLNKSGTIVLSSSAENERSAEFDDLQNCVFTYYIVEGLGGAADINANGVSAEEVYNYANPLVRSYMEDVQNPQISDCIAGEVLLTLP